MEPVIDHIQITVRDLAQAIQFYDRLMPLLGFKLEKRTRATVPEHDFEVVEYSHPRIAFAITSPRRAFRAEEIHRRRPGSLHHLAFRAKSRDEVNELHLKVAGIGAVIVSSPREYPQYSPAGYYAFFFKDPEGIKYEIVTHGESA
jgi:catechol 2,3-dioxygenase-like lactoylglutathione lyase family enzyme